MVDWWGSNETFTLQWLRKHHKRALHEALEKVKAGIDFSISKLASFGFVGIDQQKEEEEETDAVASYRIDVDGVHIVAAHCSPKLYIEDMRRQESWRVMAPM